MAGKEEKEDTGDIINSKKVTEATDISGKKKKKRRFGMELFLKTEYESRRRCSQRAEWLKERI